MRPRRASRRLRRAVLRRARAPQAAAATRRCSCETAHSSLLMCRRRRSAPRATRGRNRHNDAPAARMRTQSSGSSRGGRRRCAHPTSLRLRRRMAMPRATTGGRCSAGRVRNRRASGGGCRTRCIGCRTACRAAALRLGWRMMTNAPQHSGEARPCRGAARPRRGVARRCAARPTGRCPWGCSGGCRQMCRTRCSRSSFSRAMRAIRAWPRPHRRRCRRTWSPPARRGPRGGSCCSPRRSARPFTSTTPAAPRRPAGERQEPCVCNVKHRVFAQQAVSIIRASVTR